MFGPDAGHAGGRNFRDFFRLPPKEENRSQLVDPACRFVVCVGDLRECRAPHVRHLDSLDETRWVPHTFTFMMDIVLAYLYLVWQCAPLMQMSKLVRVPHYVDRCDLSVRDFERGCLEFPVGFLRDEARQSVDETDTNKCRGIFVKKSRQILL